MGLRESMIYILYFIQNGEYSVYDYSKWTTRINTSIKPTQLEKPPVIV